MDKTTGISNDTKVSNSR